MSEPVPLLKRADINNALAWFQPYFRLSLVNPIENEFPNWPLAPEIKKVLEGAQRISRAVEDLSGDQIPLSVLLESLSGTDVSLPPLFKSILLLYRRERAAITERLMQKTFHPELTEALEEEVNALDALAYDENFARIEQPRFPRLKDFLPVQYIEAAARSQISLQPRQYDEKFHVLQAPHLFLTDLGYFRAKCEDRDTSLAVAFVDIDDFKSLNARHTETKVDRNLLPRFMQAIEAHVFHHGYGYRQGGDEYLILLPSLSRSLSISFLQELRCKLAELSYPAIPEKTTVSIGLCVVDPDCPFTDRELLERANRAKQFAKQNGKDCIATYRGPRYIAQELAVIPRPGVAQ